VRGSYASVRQELAPGNINRAGAKHVLSRPSQHKMTRASVLRMILHAVSGNRSFLGTETRRPCGPAPDPARPSSFALRAVRAGGAGRVNHRPKCAAIRVAVYEACRSTPLLVNAPMRAACCSFRKLRDRLPFVASWAIPFGMLLSPASAGLLFACQLKE
jgi:hypothetical protein